MPSKKTRTKHSSLKRRHTRKSLQHGGKKPINVLYLGMATDIMAPLLLVPDVDTIYVLNVHDTAYGKTWEDQKNHIIRLLEDGNDKHVVPSYYAKPPKKPAAEVLEIHELKGPSTILSNLDNEDEAKWELEFIYDGKKRNLIYFYDYDFETIWPPEIKNIHHLIWNGAYSWDRLRDDDEVSHLMRKMTKERTSAGATVYALSFSHRGFPNHVRIYDGHERDGTEVAKLKLDFTDPDWWKKEYTNA